MMRRNHKKVTIGLVDDQVLFREALEVVINNFGTCRVTLSVSNGKELMSVLRSLYPPQLLLLDLNMPEMDGIKTAKWLRQEHPEIYVLVLTMYDIEMDEIRLLRLGVRGFLKKNIHPSDLRRAIDTTLQAGYYYAGGISKSMINILSHDTKNSAITEPERRFLELACTERTYKEIALAMGGISPRTVDNYRDSLFPKLNVKNRVGLVLYALKNGLIRPD